MCVCGRCEVRTAFAKVSHLLIASVARCRRDLTHPQTDWHKTHHNAMFTGMYYLNVTRKRASRGKFWWCGSQQPNRNVYDGRSDESFARDSLPRGATSNKLNLNLSYNSRHPVPSERDAPKPSVNFTSLYGTRNWNLNFAHQLRGCTQRPLWVTPHRPGITTSPSHSITILLFILCHGLWAAFDCGL